MAGKQGAASPEGRTPFDGLVPKDFFDEWPTGAVRPPPEFEAYPFTSGKPRESWLGGLELLRELVLDYRHYLAENTRQKVSSQTGLSTNTLSNFNNGLRFLKLGSFLTLRYMLPDRFAAAREALASEERRKAYLEARWVEEKLQTRMAEEIRRRVDAEVQAALRGRGPRRPSG